VFNGSGQPSSYPEMPLKVGKFDHAYSEQTLFYLNYYRKNEITGGDTTPLS